MNSFARLAPATLEGRMVAILAVSLALLLVATVFFDVAGRSSAMGWAESNSTRHRVDRMRIVLEAIAPARRAEMLESVSNCHDGFTLTSEKFDVQESNVRTERLRQQVATYSDIEADRVSIGYADLEHSDFAYAGCSSSEISLPLHAIVISLRLDSGDWLNVEVHPHEWHFVDLLGRVLRNSLAFLLVGFVAIVSIRRLSRPLQHLALAARRFADGLQMSAVEEQGPEDLRLAIQAFNAMQQQVVSDVKTRTDTLTAISHDLRTPLTALRIRAEFVEDVEVQAQLISGIDKMEKIIASALEFLKGESRSETVRQVNLSAMLASECSDFEEAGQRANYIGEEDVLVSCRPESLARAVRNLIENANKYADGASVDLQKRGGIVEIIVSDYGPGIESESIELALQPFSRLSKARESHEGGFGLGLAIAQAVANGHDGELTVGANEPRGLLVRIRFPTK